MAFRYVSPGFHVSTVLALLAALLVVGVSQTSAQDYSTHSGHTGHEGMSMVMDEQGPMDASQQAKLLADKK